MGVKRDSLISFATGKRFINRIAIFFGKQFHRRQFDRKL